MESREHESQEHFSHHTTETREAPDVPANLLLHNRLNRRDVVKLGVAGAANILLSKEFPYSTGAFAESSSNLIAENLKTELQDKHNIVIDTLKEVIDETGDPLFIEDPAVVKNIPWSVDQLKLLDNCLTSIPAHMYQPDEEGKMHITLMPEEAFPCRCVGLEYENEHFPQILFVDSYFTPEEYEDSLSFMAHELTHRQTREFKHQPNPHIDEALGDSFTVKRREMTERLYELKNPLYDKLDELEDQYPNEGEDHLSEEELEKYKFYQTLEIGLGVGWYALPTSDFPDEFVAVMAEHYIHGKNYFYENYSEIFNNENGGETIDKLYSYMKSIFKEEEYAALPTVPQQSTV